MKGKKGWIKIVEAFIAILLIAGVLLFVINKGYIGKRDISEQVYQAQIAVLREIELDANLRKDILAAETGSSVPPSVVERINQRIPDYLQCTSKICKLNEICETETPLNKNIYAQPVAITADQENFDPKQLKLFCWTSA